MRKEKLYQEPGLESLQFNFNVGTEDQECFTKFAREKVCNMFYVNTLKKPLHML